MAAIAAAPDGWAGALALSSAAAAAVTGVYYATATGRQALADGWERLAYRTGFELDDAGYARLLELAEWSGIYGVAYGLVSVAGLSLAAAVAGFLLAPRGTRAAFRQVLGVAAYASVILAIRLIIAAPVGYVRETTSSPTSLASWLGMSGQGSMAIALGTIDLMVAWWAIVTGLGLAAVYAVPARRAVAAIVGAYAGVALLAAGIGAALGAV